MAIVTLAEAKLHLRVDQDTEDSVITIYMAAAEEYIEKYINRTIPNKNLPAGSVPAPIRAACLLLIGDMYQNREAQVVAATIAENPAMFRLLQPYRVNIGI